MNNMYVSKLMKLEVSDSYKHLHTIRLKIFKLYNNIHNLIPGYMAQEFFITQERICQLELIRQFNVCDKKIINLKEKHIHNLRNLKPIKFYATMNSDSNVTISNTYQSEESHCVQLDPEEFDLDHDITKLNNKWFINLSDITIPSEVQSLLQLGDRFSVPHSDRNRDDLLMGFIKNIECNITHLQDEQKNDIRNRSMIILKDFYKRDIVYNNHDRLIVNWISSTREFTRDHPDVLFMSADKGNITVAMHKDMYLYKMNELLTDINTYEVVTKDPIKKIISDLRTHLSRWKHKGYISQTLYLSLLSSDGVLPRAYGVPKVHKKDCPLRIIVSCLNSPLYNLSLYLHKILQKSIPESNSYIKNSFQLIDKLRDIQVRDDWDLISLDVTSLFTNVPTDLVITGITNRWENISKNTSFSLEEFIIALRFVLSSTFFKFNETIYKQIFGCPMGSPLSPILADITMMDLEDKAIENINLRLPFYVRYVDDILTLVPRDCIVDILGVFNSIHERIKFTVEIGHNKSINFLDVTLHITDNGLIFNWYRKPTFSGRFLNFASQHPVAHKKGVLMGLVDRALLLSHPQFFRDNLYIIINILLENGYPLNFIFRNITERIQHHIYGSNNINHRHKDNNDSNNNKKFFVLPYIDSVSNRFRFVSRNYGFETAYTIHNYLNNFIKKHKDKTDKNNKCNIVYRIPCGECDASYVGQSKRQLRTRVEEHRRSVRNGVSSSVISDHCIELNHRIDWDNVRICDVENSYRKRLISEMLFIKRQSNGMNIQSDTESLPISYSSIIGLLPPL